MVKKMAKFFVYALFFIFALVALSPKSSVYYFGEKQLQKFGVVVSNETLSEKLLTLHVENLEISVKEIDAALIEEVDIILLGVYNSLRISDIKLSSLVESYLPSRVDSLDVEYSLLNPLTIVADGTGEFGEASVKVNIKERSLEVMLKPSKKMFSKYKKTLKMFKKSESGEYVYAKNF